MPNWCQTTLTVTGPAKSVRAFQATAASNPKQEVLSFEAFLPCPAELRIDCDSFGSIGHPAFYGSENAVREILTYPWVVAEKVTTQKQLQDLLDKQNPQYRKQADAYQQNLEKHGATTWYTWANEHWGTKWDASDVVQQYAVPPEAEDDSIGAAGYVFQTAWCPASPVFRKMSEMFPDCTIEASSDLEGSDGVEIIESYCNGIEDLSL